MLKSHRKTILETLGRKPIHPFPARMAPGIALDALGYSKKTLRVLDPMAGSGTVLAVAKANGHQAFGFDLDPLAVLLSDVWTRTVVPDEVLKKAHAILNRSISVSESLAIVESYPPGSDKETKRFIRYWFDPCARRQLTALSIEISKVRNKAVRQALWCGFSRLIISKQAGASRAMDLSHSRPHRVFKTAPVKPLTGFIAAIRSVVSNCPHAKVKTEGPEALISLGDARRLDIPDNSIDLVLTSPPYLNAIDYMRCSKFSLVWMGYNIKQLRDIRGKSVGAETISETAMQTDWVAEIIVSLKLKPRLSNRDHALLSRYVFDMGRSLAEVARVLQSKGRAVYVVGDSTIRGTFIRNSSIVAAVGVRNGLTLKSKQTRDLPANRRYLPPPMRRDSSASLDTRMRREVVLVFDKSRSARIKKAVN